MKKWLCISLLFLLVMTGCADGQDNTSAILSGTGPEAVAGAMVRASLTVDAPALVDCMSDLYIEVNIQNGGMGLHDGEDMREKAVSVIASSHSEEHSFAAAAITRLTIDSSQVIEQGTSTLEQIRDYLGENASFTDAQLAGLTDAAVVKVHYTLTYNTGETTRDYNTLTCVLEQGRWRVARYDVGVWGF